MKIVYMSEEFNIEEVDLYVGEIVFSTNNTMGWFDEGKKGEKTKFKIYFDSVYELFTKKGIESKFYELMSQVGRFTFSKSLFC